jgi:hypothetical protein
MDTDGLRLLGRAVIVLLALLVSAPGWAGDLSKAAKRQLVEEWKQRTGIARRDLNQVQIRSSFRMSMRNEPADLIPARAQVAVTGVDVDNEHHALDLDVVQVGTKRSTEVHLILDKPFGDTLTDEQKSQLDVMWSRLVALDAADLARNSQEPGPDPRNNAVLHVIRPHFSGPMGGAHVSFSCDGVNLVGLAGSNYFTVDMESGPHQCYLYVERNQVEFSLQAGQVHYLEVQIPRIGRMKHRFLDPKEGEAAIQKMTYVESAEIFDRWNVRPSGK